MVYSIQVNTFTNTTLIHKKPRRDKAEEKIEIIVNNSPNKNLPHTYH